MTRVYAIITGADSAALNTAILAVQQNSAYTNFEIKGAGYEATLKYWVLVTYST